MKINNLSVWKIICLFDPPIHQYWEKRNLGFFSDIKSRRQNHNNHSFWHHSTRMTRNILTVFIIVNLPGLFHFKPSPKINELKVNNTMKLKAVEVYGVENKFEDFLSPGKGRKDLNELKNKVFLDQNERRHKRHQLRLRHQRNQAKSSNQGENRVSCDDLDNGRVVRILLRIHSFRRRNHLAKYWLHNCLGAKSSSKHQEETLSTPPPGPVHSYLRYFG